MSIVTVWINPSSNVQLVQLSDDPADGTPQEQIAYFATLAPYQGYSCVSEDYTGTAPETDPSLWRWDGSAITSLPAPQPQPSVAQVRAILSELGMTQAQLDNLFAAAAAL